MYALYSIRVAVKGLLFLLKIALHVNYKAIICYKIDRRKLFFK